MYQVIARKYRPQTFSELVGQEHVRSTLENAISMGRIAHGYIFSGQRGTGKTTVARILARCLNCQNGPTGTPCMQCSACLETAAGSCVDVIEIDAASNRGINEMRELRENVRYRPARDRFKVFIVDEAHQITSEAFNALLKTLEEPPEWVVFMLCTTETHKIPTTIASRCQQFNFRSVDFAEVVERMEWICGQEGITADPETLGVIAQVGEGSVRDSLSALDQAIACCGTTLKATEVRDLLGLFSLDSMGQIAEALDASDSRRMLEIVQELERNGRNLQHFCRELARYMRNLMVVRLVGPGTRLLAATGPEQERLHAVATKFSEEDLTRYLQIVLDMYRELQYSLQPRLHLEIGLLRLVHAGRIVSIEEAIAGLGPAKPSPPANPSPPAQTARASVSTTPVAPAPFRQPSPPPPPVPATGPLKARLLAHLNDNQLTMLADAVEHSDVSELPGEAKFAGPREFSLAFKDAAMRNALQRVTGKAIKVVFVPTDFSAAAAPAAKPPDDQLSGRVLEHPEVQRFQEAFPGAQVRNIRNLKD